MANQVPGSLLTSAAQTADIASYFIAVVAMRNRAYTMAQPQAKGMGLLMDLPSAEVQYAIPFGPIAIGKVIRYPDGKPRPAAMRPQLSKISGACQKRGIEPLQLLESDRTAMRVPYVQQNIMARGKAERMLEDAERSVALENGTSATLQPSYDDKAFYATDHYVDPVGKTGSQSNLITGALTADTLREAKTKFRTWLSENNKDPIYAGFEPAFLLEVPTSLEGIAKKVCERSHIAEGNAAVENIESGTQFWVNTYLTDQRAWYLHVINAGMSLCYRIVHREMQRWDQGPDSPLYTQTKAIEIYADEFTDYRLTAWELSLKSTGV